MINKSDSPYLEAIRQRVLVYDGAMGTNIQRYHLTPEDFGGKALEGCNDHLVLTRPDVIQDTMAFMFETRRVWCPTRHALESAELQADYFRCWAGLRKHFDPTRR